MGRVVVVTGPTAAGKSEAALILAERLGAEIVSADSMQVYRGLDIGTAKPTPEDQARVPHHLIDLVDPAESYDVKTYQDQARSAILDIHGRGRLPLIVGGTGLYVRAAVDELDFPPRGEPELRKMLARRADVEGPEALHAELATRDPAAAERIDPHNIRRVIRALEVVQLTGEPFSEQTAHWEEHRSLYDLRLFAITMERRKLYARIDARVDRQIKAGLIDEVKGLLDRGYADYLTSRQAICYKELVAYFQGTTTLEAAVDLIKQRNRNYAKRQLTWLRRDPRVEWVEATDRAAADVADEIERRLDGSVIARG